MWLTNDVQIPIATNTGMRKEHVVRQSVKEQKTSLLDLSYNSQDFSITVSNPLYEDDHYLLEHLLNWNTADQFHQPGDNSDNSQHHDCQFCPGSPRCGVANDQRIQAAVQQHRPTAGPSSVSPSVSVPSASGSGTPRSPTSGPVVSTGTADMSSTSLAHVPLVSTSVPHTQIRMSLPTLPTIPSIIPLLRPEVPYSRQTI